MKYAQSDSGAKIYATAHAPQSASCPFCGGDLILRQRKVMLSEAPIYYWRHQPKVNRDCPARHRPNC